MRAAIKSEFRKLLTVRSTYYIFGFTLFTSILFAFYIEGYKAGLSVVDPNKLAGEVTNSMGMLTTLGALVGVLLMTHEYRYNTIMYTLTSSRSRTQVLLAKFIAISGFALFFSLIFAATAPSLTYLGVQAKGLHLAHQNFPVLSLMSRALFYGWAFSMLALILATIIRIQVGAIAALFLIPGTAEALLGLLLKKNSVYLPFTALNSLLMRRPDLASISYAHAAVVALIYIIVGWIIAWQLFLRRDAN